MDHDLQIDQWVDVRLLTIMVTEEAILLVTRMNVKISSLHYFRNMFVVFLPVVTIQAQEADIQSAGTATAWRAGLPLG